ncbi:MAG: pilin [Lachnospiraceae bacterium]|nr:pilin [bacterium]MDY5517906.1 pilin [Lachnospiraceae bacterium]
MNFLSKVGMGMEKMRCKADKLIIGAMLAMSGVMAPTTVAFAGSTKQLDVSGAQVAIVDLINSLLNPILAIVGALGTLYCVLLGVKYAKAEEPQEREKAKQHLRSAIIGFVLIFVLIVALRLLMPQFKVWMNANAPSMN